MKRILAVVPVHNRKETTLRFLPALKGQQTAGFTLDTLIVDDGSTDGTASAIREHFPETMLFEGDGNLWWAGGINAGFSYALKHGYDFVYTVNDDIVLSSDTLEKLYAALGRTKAPAVASSAFHKPDGTLLLAGWRCHGPLRKWTHNRHLSPENTATQNIDSLSSKSTLIPTAVIRSVGLFDRHHFPQHFSDIEYFERVKKAGFPIIVDGKSRIITQGSDSNFHQLLVNRRLSTLLSTFRDIKYAHHLKTVYYSTTRTGPLFIGLTQFAYRMLPYVVWILCKIVVPRPYLRALLIRTGRLNG